MQFFIFYVTDSFLSQNPSSESNFRKTNKRKFWSILNTQENYNIATKKKKGRKSVYPQNQIEIIKRKEVLKITSMCSINTLMNGFLYAYKTPILSKLVEEALSKTDLTFYSTFMEFCKNGPSKDYYESKFTSLFFCNEFFLWLYFILNSSHWKMFF